jgi:hypothetical protein
MATVIAPRGKARSPHDLGTMPLRGKHMAEDTAAWVQAAHDLNRQLGLEMHAWAVLTRKMMVRAAGRGIGRFAAGTAARRAVRPLMRAASQADSAANGVLRFWKAYMAAAAEIQAAKDGQRRGRGLGRP